MPEVRFRVRWPNGKVEACYSPSTAVLDHFCAGTRYPIADFLARSRHALLDANERVRSRFGMGCSRAMGQLASIEKEAAQFANSPNAMVLVESLERAS